MENLRNLQKLLADGFLNVAEYEHRRCQLIDKLTGTSMDGVVPPAPMALVHSGLSPLALGDPHEESDDYDFENDDDTGDLPDAIDAHNDWEDLDVGDADAVFCDPVDVPSSSSSLLLSSAAAAAARQPHRGPRYERQSAEANYKKTGPLVRRMWVAGGESPPPPAAVAATTTTLGLSSTTSCAYDDSSVTRSLPRRHGARPDPRHGPSNGPSNAPRMLPRYIIFYFLQWDAE